MPLLELAVSVTGVHEYRNAAEDKSFFMPNAVCGIPKLIPFGQRFCLTFPMPLRVASEVVEAKHLYFNLTIILPEDFTTDDAFAVAELNFLSYFK